METEAQDQELLQSLRDLLRQTQACRLSTVRTNTQTTESPAPWPDRWLEGDDQTPMNCHHQELRP